MTAKQRANVKKTTRRRKPMAGGFLLPPLNEFRPPNNLEQCLANMRRGPARKAAKGTDLWRWQQLDVKLILATLRRIASDWDVDPPQLNDRDAPFTLQLAAHSIPFVRAYESWNKFPDARRREARVLSHVLDVQDRFARGGKRYSKLNVCKLLAFHEVGVGAKYKSGESLLNDHKKIGRGDYWRHIRNALGPAGFLLYLRLLVNGTSEAPAAKLPGSAKEEPGNRPKLGSSKAST